MNQRKQRHDSGTAASVRSDDRSEPSSFSFPEAQPRQQTRRLATPSSPSEIDTPTPLNRTRRFDGLRISQQPRALAVPARTFLVSPDTSERSIHSEASTKRARKSLITSGSQTVEVATRVCSLESAALSPEISSRYGAPFVVAAGNDQKLRISTKNASRVPSKTAVGHLDTGFHSYVPVSRKEVHSLTHPFTQTLPGAHLRHRIHPWRSDYRGRGGELW